MSESASAADEFDGGVGDPHGRRRQTARFPAAEVGGDDPQGRRRWKAQSPPSGETLARKIAKNRKKSCQKVLPLAFVALGGLRWWWCLDGGRRTGEGRGYLYLERLFACILSLLGRAAVKGCCRGRVTPECEALTVILWTPRFHGLIRSLMRQDRFCGRGKAWNSVAVAPSCCHQVLRRSSGGHQGDETLWKRWETNCLPRLPATMVTKSEVVDLHVKQDDMEERMRFGVPNLHQLTV